MDELNKLHFTLYGQNKSISFEDLKNTPYCYARTENSGSEGCYVEIARWNDKKRKWQRFAFLKFLGCEISKLSHNWSDVISASYVTITLNNHWNTESSITLIHNFEDWNSDDDETDSLRNSTMSKISTMYKIKKGQTVYSISPNIESIKTHIITKIGKKYFYVDNKDTKINLNTMRDSTMYGYGYSIQIYLTKQEIEDKQFIDKTLIKVRQFDFEKLNIDQLKRINEILNEVEK